MKFGDRILVAHNLDSLNEIAEYTIVKVQRDTIICKNSRGESNTFYSAFCWPIRVKDELLTIVKHRMELKKAFDDSMKLVYELKNAIARGEK